MRTFVRFTLLALALVAAGISCSDTPTEPKADPAGPLALLLTSPNADDGAVILRIDTAIDSVRLAPGSAYQLVPSPNSSPVRILVHGALAPGSELARIWVRDRAAVAASAVTVEQVASGSSYQQRSPTGYSVKLQPR